MSSFLKAKGIPGGWFQRETNRRSPKNHKSQVAESVAKAHRCRVENATFMPDPFPPTDNDPQLWRWLESSAGLDAPKLWDMPATMGSEDFAFFSERVPGAFVLLGQGTGQSSY